MVSHVLTYHLTMAVLKILNGGRYGPC